MAQKIICPKNNNLPHFQNQWHRTLIVNISFYIQPTLGPLLVPSAYCAAGAVSDLAREYPANCGTVFAVALTLKLQPPPPLWTSLLENRSKSLFAGRHWIV